MYHSVTTNIPVASTETLRRRRLLLDSNGIHLTYNVPRKSPKTSRLAPVKPFAGMTISFLIYVQDNAEKWCLQVGSGEERSNKRFRIGYTGHGDQYGRYFIGEKNNQWNGPNTKDHPGYPGRQYLHVHIHFSGPDKAEGYINDEKLGEAQSSSLNQFPDLVHFGSEKEPPPTICSIHWTTWAPGKPAASQAIKENLFQAGTFVPLDATIFEARVGTEMTVECKYIKTFAEKDGVRIGVAPIGTTGLYNMVTISGYRNPNRTYIVRVSIMEGSYILAFAERAFRVEHYTRAEAPEGYFFDLTSNMKPIRVFVICGLLVPVKQLTITTRSVVSMLLGQRRFLLLLHVSFGRMPWCTGYDGADLVGAGAIATVLTKNYDWLMGTLHFYRHVTGLYLK